MREEVMSGLVGWLVRKWFQFAPAVMAGNGVQLGGKVGVAGGHVVCVTVVPGSVTVGPGMAIVMPG
jgi:hypothetical protein